MAARQSSLLCAPPGLLLLLIGVISSHLPEVQAAPIDFWCNSQARKSMENMIDELEEGMLQQKRAEVIGALEMFRDGVRGARDQTTVKCQTDMLENLGRHIANYLAIIKRLQIQDDTGTPSHPAVQNDSQTSLNKVVKEYRRLLEGKLERLATDLQDSICNVERGTT